MAFAAGAAVGQVAGALDVEIGEVDLGPGEEHQKDETELGQERQQGLFVGHPAEAAASDDDTGQDFADNDGQPEAFEADEQQRDDECQGDDDQERGKAGFSFHTVSEVSWLEQFEHCAAG